VPTIQLKKKSRTQTNNNSYNVLLKNGRRSLPIGSYNQDVMIISLDIDSYILAVAKGYLISEKFKKIFLRTTFNIVNKKNIKIIF
jgi:hypothetical protein